MCSAIIFENTIFEELHAIVIITLALTGKDN